MKEKGGKEKGSSISSRHIGRKGGRSGVMLRKKEEKRKRGARGGIEVQ